MLVTYILIGFKQYIIINKIMYRKEYKVRCKLYKWQYRARRKINISIKDGVKVYWLVKGKSRKFYSLKKLKHRLKKVL